MGVIWTIDGIASSLGDGVLGGLPAWGAGERLVCWFVCQGGLTSGAIVWCGHRRQARVGGIIVGSGIGGRPIRGHCVARGVCGLQLLAMTVSSSLSSSLSKRIWKGLLCRVRRWCIIGSWRMVFGAMMVLNVVATLGGAATGTLGGVAGTTLGDVGPGVGGVLGRPDMIVVSWQIASRCFSLAVAVFGIVRPRRCKRLPAASMVMLFSNMVGTWQ